MVYWFTGQSGSGKTALANKLKFWLNAEKKNWRRSVHVIDDKDLENQFTEESYAQIAFYISKFLSDKGDDVVVSVQSANREQRNEFKSKTKMIEIYCHTKSRQGSGIDINYEPPIQNYVDLDTTTDVDTTFNKLIRLLV